MFSRGGGPLSLAEVEAQRGQNVANAVQAVGGSENVIDTAQDVEGENAVTDSGCNFSNTGTQLFSAAGRGVQGDKPGNLGVALDGGHGGGDEGSDHDQSQHLDDCSLRVQDSH